VSISGSADNIGDYQQRLGRRLANAHERNETVTVYVNAADPADSIIDRELRWGLLGFKSIFVLVFGGIGSGLLIYALLSRSDRKSGLPVVVRLDVDAGQVSAQAQPPEMPSDDSGSRLDFSPVTYTGMS
jgi:hypothetical protein